MPFDGNCSCPDDQFFPSPSPTPTTWVTIIVTDLNDYLVGAQATALRQAALASGQSDPFTNVMTAVVGRVRTEIQAWPTNRVSATALTVPPSIKDLVIYMILEEMSARLPSLKFTDQQQKRADDARAFIRRIARGEARVEVPPDPLNPPGVQVNSAIQVVTRTCILAGRNSVRGL